LVVLAVSTFAILGGCGGSGSSGGSGSNGVDTSQLVGLWNGTITVSVNGQSNTGNSYTHISNSGTAGEIVVGDVCGDGSGPNATVTSPTGFSVHAMNCPAASLGTCSSVVLAVTGGNGSVSGGTLTLNASGTIGGCGQTFSYTLSFNGHK
jgi:hypothetical protein